MHTPPPTPTRGYKQEPIVKAGLGESGEDRFSSVITVTVGKCTEVSGCFKGRMRHQAWGGGASRGRKGEITKGWSV